MPQVPVPFAEWRPDLATLDNEFASIAENVFNGANSYLPFPGLQAQTSFALPATATGLYAARTTTGGLWKMYAGTATKLYMFSVGAGWTDASRTSNPSGPLNYSVPPGDLWRFKQSGDKVIAVNANDAPQEINVDSGTNFAALAGSPPQAQNVEQVGPHLVLSGLTGNKRRIQWSAVEDNTGWTVNTNLSDIQEMPDGGDVLGVAGGEVGYVVQERAIRVMQYLPGDTTNVFTFQRVVLDRGCISKYGFTVVSGILYFPAEDGFFALAGQQLNPIGEGKINDWWLAHSDPTRRHLTLAFDFQHAHRIGWAFYGSGSSPIYDKMLIYDWALQRWSYATVSAQIWATMATIGLDLDSVGPEPGDALVDSTAGPLDSPAYFGGRPTVGAINADRILSYLTGQNLVATLETAEAHLVPGFRSFVSDTYPLVDAAADTVTAGTRERLGDPVQWGNPVGVEVTGSATLFSSSRLHRFRVTTAAGEPWTHAQGVLVEAQQDGSIA